MVGFRIVNKYLMLTKGKRVSTPTKHLVKIPAKKNTKEEVRYCIQYGYCPNSKNCLGKNKCDRQEANEYDL
jgi:hypothetical protein